MILRIEKERKERTIWREKCRPYIAHLGGEVSHTSPTLNEASFPALVAVKCPVRGLQHQARDIIPPLSETDELPSIRIKVKRKKEMG